MKRKVRSWLQIALIFSLIIAGLTPAGSASAAPMVDITNLATGTTQPPDQNITTVTTSQIDIQMNLNDFTNTQLQNLKAEIHNQTTGQRSTVTIIPEPIGQSTVSYVVRNVPLSEGLNKITPVLDTLRYEPAWVYYTPATTISDLKVNDQTLLPDQFYPSNPALDTLVVISGRAPNASSLTAYLNGSTEQVNVYVDPAGIFNLTADKEGTNFVDMNLRPGDNLITLIASNPSRTYTQQRKILYDDGGPFMFDGQINEVGSAEAAKDLYLKPLLKSSNVRITGKVKVNKDNSGVLSFNQVKVLNQTFDLVVPGDPLNESEPDLDGDTSDNLAVNAAWTPADGDYVVFDFDRTLSLGTGRNQTIDFTFIRGGTSEIGSSFDVTLQDNTQPYVDYVEVRIGGAGNFVRMSEAPLVTEITQQPVTFRVHFSGTVSASTKLELRRDGAAIEPDAVPVFTGGETTKEITFTNTLPSGDYQVVFVPFSDASTPLAGNGRTYQLSVTSAPYVIFQNLYEGEVLGSTDSGRTITFRTVNIPDIDRVTVEINNNIVNVTPGADANVYQFSLGGSEGPLREGANTVKVRIYEDDARTRQVAETTLNVFLITVNIPQFVTLEPVEQPGRDDYRTTNVDNTYITNLTEVRITGTVTDATNGTVEVIGGPDDGQTSTLSLSGGSFTTAQYDLASTGNTTFVFTISNDSGIQAIRTVTITREVLPYTIVSPIVTTTPEGEIQANVNANFVKFRVEAEASDRIMVDDIPALEISEDLYEFEVRDLRAGRNKVEFTILRGTEEIDVELNVNNVNTAMEGAAFKSPIKNKITAFNNQVQLNFPRGTNLRRNDPADVNTFVTNERQILFGIANSKDGRIDKLEYNADSTAISRLDGEERIRFNAVSPLFWIDGGYVEDDETDLEVALRGSGQDPYATPKFYVRDPEDQMVPTQAGTLTLQYNSVIRTDGWKYVTVFHFDIQENEYGQMEWSWQNLGGTVDTKKNTITVPFYNFGYYQVMYMDQSFNDVIAHDWARDDLDVLYSKGLMFNKEDDWFRPYDAMTRGEFATLLVKAFDIPLDYQGDLTFSDVARVDVTNYRIYNYKYIETAARAGIIRGMENNKFNPRGGITREQAAVMIARAANLKLDAMSDKLTADLQKEFTDANDIDLYAQPAVAAVVDEGYILGMENVLLPGQRRATYRFEPDTTFTRDQAAAVLIRVLREAKKIPK